MVNGEWLMCIVNHESLTKILIFHFTRFSLWLWLTAVLGMCLAYTTAAKPKCDGQKNKQGKSTDQKRADHSHA
jgi:hypothetical protein